MGVSTSTVYNKINQYDIQAPEVPKVLSERDKKIIEMRKNGATFKEISEELHIAASTAYECAQKNGIVNESEKEQTKRIVDMRKKE